MIVHAMQLIADHGLAVFSLRGLAESLGVAPNAVYNHIQNREDLLDAITERFVASIRLPAGEQPWPEWVRSCAVRLRSQLLRQPGLTELMLARAGATAAGPRLLARFLARLESAGVDRAVAHVAWHSLLTVVVGSVSQARGRDPSSRATFEAVLDIAISGLQAAAAAPPSAQALALLDAHGLTQP
ncbi:MAG: TetR/AcrR family transcriptional regulator [Solirubrobacteraceae bacterium]